MIKFLLLFVGLLSPNLVCAHTIKTNHSDVKLFSSPAGNSIIGKIDRFEEVQVLQTRYLKNGKKWYQVRLLRHPRWRKKQIDGWVRAKSFVPITTLVSDDQPTEAGPCLECTRARNETRRQAQAIKDIATQSANSSEFIWPVSGEIRSGFGMRRHPITGLIRLHNGTDIAANSGKAVVAAKAGIVSISHSGCRTGARSCNKGAGNMVTIDHGDGTVTKYLHLSPNCNLPAVGVTVEQGQNIACVGSTGASTGPHLHFSIIVDGKPINPLRLLPGRGNPL